MAIRMTLTDVGYPMTDLQAISAWVQESETPDCGRGTCPCKWTAASSIPTMRRRSSPIRCGNGCKHSGWGNWVVTRIWGRIGARLGRVVHSPCVSYEDALRELATIEKRRQSRHYQPVAKVLY